MTDSVVPNFHHTFFEYGAGYSEPALEAWNAGKLSQALLGHLGKWGVGLGNISVNPSPANAAEVHTRIELFKGKVVLEVGIGQIRLSANDPNWSDAGILAEVIKETLSGVSSVLGVSIGHQWAALAFHFSVEGKEPGDLTKIFINPANEILNEPGVRSHGVSIYRDDGHFVLDTSVVYSNALFMKIFRDFPGDVSFRDIGKMIHGEEERYLSMLGLGVG